MIKIPVSLLAVPFALTTLEIRADPNTFSAATAAAHAANATTEPIAAGKFNPTWESLSQYETPDWFRDAKFGIWAHWGPQCQPEMGDWYAKLMYQTDGKGKRPNLIPQFHNARYGHPSQFGFKDVIETWQAERWDPEKLMALYKRAGAQYFMTLANHHDGLDLWDSKYQPWNSTLVGPKKNLVGGWEKAARKAGLRFGVSVHTSHSWSWYEPAQGADKEGPQASVPYDGNMQAEAGKGKWWEGLDPQDLYAQNHPLSDAAWEWQLKPAATGPDDPRLPSPAYIKKFYNRTLDLINKYHPDLVYFDDSVLPFNGISDVGLKITAHLYNQDAARHGGKLEAVVTGKHLNDDQKKCIVYDIERGKSPDILPQVWQTDTCIGGWHYDRRIYEQNHYKTATEVIQMLADIVSKNGNLMLNIPVRGDGTIDDIEIGVLEKIAKWMEINHEAIFSTRPWRVYGEGPSTTAAHEKGSFDGIKDTGKFSAEDIRFTRSKDGKTVYALILGWPGDGTTMTVKSLTKADHVHAVSLLGSHAKLNWKESSDGLQVTFPKGQPTESAVVLKLSVQPGA